MNNADREKVAALAVQQRTRKPYWFEKFKWFISYSSAASASACALLVLAGQDQHQNELLVKY